MGSAGRFNSDIDSAMQCLVACSGGANCRLQLLAPKQCLTEPHGSLHAETRATKHGMDMEREIGFVCNRKSNETLSRRGPHAPDVCASPETSSMRSGAIRICRAV